nr:MAG TPA: hypothetical protein [Caudoviricetes sp.]
MVTHSLHSVDLFLTLLYILLSQYVIRSCRWYLLSFLYPSNIPLPPCIIAR